MKTNKTSSLDLFTTPSEEEPELLITQLVLSEESLITCSEMKTKKTPYLDLFTTASKELIFTHLVLITCSEMKMISILSGGILEMNNKPNAFAVSLIKYLINFLNT